MTRISGSGTINFVACVTMLVLGFVTVAIRFMVRKTLKQLPTAAEGFCVLSLVFFAGYTGVLLHYIFNSASAGEFDVLLLISSPLQIKNLMKTLFIAEHFFNAVITAVKLSILFFYYSIFSISEGFTRALWTSGILCLVWYIVATFVTVFQCNPIHAYWDMMAMPPYCHSSARLLLGTEITNLFLDTIILCLPISMVRTLHLPTLRKLSVAGIFLLGSFVCVASAVRLRYIWIPPNYDININTSMVMFWSTLQLGMAIICSCLPTYGPIFALGSPLLKRFKKLYGSLTSSKIQSFQRSRWVGKKQPNSDDVDVLTWQQFDNQSFSCQNASSNAVRHEEPEYPMAAIHSGSITVKNTVDVV